MYGFSRTCGYCGERGHVNDDWVQFESGLVVCYTCSILDIADEWFAIRDVGVDPAEEKEWDERAN